MAIFTCKNEYLLFFVENIVRRNMTYSLSILQLHYSLILLI